MQHLNLAATLEVLEIGGRPAVLQEWLTGLPSSEWPSLAHVPAVWHRLVLQAAQGLQAAHAAGLTHVHLHAGRALVTGEGVLKLCGFGEPAWLLDSHALTGDKHDVASDLAALGQIAMAWAGPVPQRDSAGSRPWPAGAASRTRAAQFRRHGSTLPDSGCPCGRAGPNT